MQIGETIKEYRKNKKLTQEQMAHYLGVSTPAVNKWENGVSYPDITLLAPIARLLDINLETLLSFERNLTDEEINMKAEKLVEKMSSEGFEKAFEYAMSEIQEYTNCDKLILNFCKMLQGYKIMENIGGKTNQEAYDEKMHELYVRLTESREQEVASSACASLATECIHAKDYEQAQLYLDRIPKAGFDKRMMQAGLYKDQGKKEEAYQLYEKIIYSSYLNMSMAMTFLSTFYCEDGQKKIGKEFALMAQKIAETLQLGKHQSTAPLLAYAGAAKDPVMTMKAMKGLIGSIDSIAEIRKSPLFAHQPNVEHKNATDGTMIKHKEVMDAKKIQQYKKLYKDALSQDDEMAYMRDNKEYQQLIKELDENDVDVSVKNVNS